MLVKIAWIVGVGERPATHIKSMAYGNVANQDGHTWILNIEKYQKEIPIIKIDYELLTDEAYRQKVITNLKGGNQSTPDFAYMRSEPRWSTPWQEAGQQFDHYPSLDASYYRISLISLVGLNGEIYYIPRGTPDIKSVLYMNEELVKALGFSVPKTYGEIVAMVSAARQSGLFVLTINGEDGQVWSSSLLSSIIACRSGDVKWISRAMAGERKFTDEEFIESLAMLRQMVGDGVVSPAAVQFDDEMNLANFNSNYYLFMIGDHRLASGIDPSVAVDTILLAWPFLQSENTGGKGVVAAIDEGGYGLTKKGGANPEVRYAALKFLEKYFYSEPEVTERLRRGEIVAPILKNYKIPADLPAILKQKIEFSRKVIYCDTFEAFLPPAANAALNEGLKKIVAGTATPEEVAAEVERLARE